MRFRFLAVWLRLQKKRKTKKSMSVIGVLPKLRKFFGAAKSCDMTHAVPWFGIQRPRCRAPGRLTGSSGGLGGWVGVGSDVPI